MDTVSNLRTELQPEWHESFPETRTLPGGWDLAEMPRYTPQDSERRPPVASAPVALDPTLMERRPDPFPEPQDFPCGWDLSDLLALEKERMTAKNSETNPWTSFFAPLSLNAVAYETV